MDSKILNIEGKGIPLRGNDIDTDQVVPARFLKEITFQNMGNYLFYDARFDQKKKELDHVLNKPEFKEGNILFVQENFGCGSSREHAAQAVKRYGIDAVVGMSFSEIFSGNCKSLGVPIVRLEKAIINECIETIENDPTTPVHIDIEEQILSIGDKKITYKMEPTLRNSLIQGTWDSLALLNQNEDKAKALSDSLPY